MLHPEQKEGSSSTSPENRISLYWLRPFNFYHFRLLTPLSDVSPNNGTTVPSPRPRPLWPRSGVEPEPCVCEWVDVGVAGDSVPWDTGRRTYNATFQFPLHSAEGSPPLAGQWAAGPRPAEGGREGKWLAARLEIDSTPSSPTSLPTVRDRDVIHRVKPRQNKLM